MVRNVTTKQNLRRTSSSRTAISVLMALFLVFLPLSSWSSSIITSVGKVSESFMIIDTSDEQNSAMPCHSSDSDMARSDQSLSNGDCCSQSGMSIQCDNCEHHCTFVKHFSNTIDSFNVDFSSCLSAIKPINLIATQFPTPPFRPPAA